MDIHQPFNDKMKKTLPLLHHPELKEYVPMTDWYSEEKAKEMIRQYSSLFIKPNVGRIGIGVMRLKKLGDSQYEIHYQDKAEVFETLDQALIALREKMNSSKKYLIQQGIELATVLERPFDFRIVMHKINGTWRRSAWAAKISPPKMVVTNNARGGVIITAEQALGTNKNNFDYKKAQTDLNEVSIKICQVLDSQFSFCIVGLDMAVDKNGKVWFIEANTTPDHSMFRKLGDPLLYRRLRRKERQIRRTSRRLLKEQNENQK
ncbi:YheC/YheD family protein [Mesobacillus maritimus]|uniref:YheC/YheD family protein n=1 Tax=Mesobacillus maritimus TaxID=1643336 RepID=UPI00203A5D7D|nr:YheC/YheD family protein [Mesobacillus maritimus]MCM3584651.1 YheC/YheD family protein [Mesobacillus maritimus]